VVPVTVTVRSGTVGPNPAQGMDFCFRPSVLCCPASKLKVDNICVCVSKNVELRGKERKKAGKVVNTPVPYSEGFGFESDPETGYSN
jgi:hypothetical protein